MSTVETHACPDCGDPLEIAATASYTPDAGETWISAKAMGVKVARCVNHGESPRMFTILADGTVEPGFPTP